MKLFYFITFARLTSLPLFLASLFLSAWTGSSSDERAHLLPLRAAYRGLLSGPSVTAVKHGVWGPAAGPWRTGTMWPGNVTDCGTPRCAPRCQHICPHPWPPLPSSNAQTSNWRSQQRPVLDHGAQRHAQVWTLGTELNQDEDGGFRVSLSLKTRGCVESFFQKMITWHRSIKIKYISVRNDLSVWENITDFFNNTFV